MRSQIMFKLYTDTNKAYAKYMLNLACVKTVAHDLGLDTFVEPADFTGIGYEPMGGRLQNGDVL